MMEAFVLSIVFRGVERFAGMISLRHLFWLSLFPSLIFSQWIRTPGPVIQVPVALLSVAVKGDTMFAGAYSDGGVFRSTNNGVTWKEVLGSGYVYTIVIQNGETYVGNYQGVYRSSDYGETWKRDVSGLTPGFGVYSLAIRDSLVIAGTDLGVFRSTDGGDLWAGVSPSLPSASQDVFSVEFKDSILFAGTYQGAFRSDDFGDHWQLTSLTSRVNTFLVDGKCLYAGTGGFGIFKSTDNGENWVSENSGLPGQQVNTYLQSIFSLSVKDHKLYTCPQDDGDIYVSVDSGNTWSRASQRITNAYVFEFAVKGDDLFAATFEGVQHSKTSDSIWTPIFSHYTKRTSTGTVFAANNALLASGYATYWNGTIFDTYYSTDRGNTWTGIDSVSAIGEFLSMGSKSTVLLGGSWSGIYRSPDEGKHWTVSDSGLSRFPVNVIISTGKAFFAGTGRFFPFASPYPRQDEVGGVFESTDEGFTWFSAGLSDTAINSLTYVDSVLYAGGLRGVYKSTNTGLSWMTSSSGLPQGTSVSSLTAIGNTLFAGTSRGIYVSSDQGSYWQAVNKGLPLDSTQSLETQLFYVKNLLLAATNCGLYLSSNPFEGWNNVSLNLSGASAAIHSLTADDANLYVGTGDGVWSRPLLQLLEDVRKPGQGLPVAFQLFQNYPNPFNPSTTLLYGLPARSRVKLQVYNILGQIVADLVNAEQGAGWNQVVWNANVASGLYFYRLEAVSVSDPGKRFVDVKKMILLK
jgi:hypothetical protein